MEYLRDPIVLVLLCLSLLVGFYALRRYQKSEFWIYILTLFLFVLPRAGVFLPPVKLPLPFGYILVSVLIIEWIGLRQVHHREKTRFHSMFLLDARGAGFGRIYGLSLGGDYQSAFLELCFYFFAIGVFFYAKDTFCEKAHFLRFIQLILVVAVGISVYGILQRHLGSSILVNKITYNSATGLAKSYLDVPLPNRRVLSSYGDPNVLAGQLIVFIGITMAIVLSKNIHPRTKMVSLIALAACVTCLIFTGSRSGLIGMVLVTMLVLCWRSRWGYLLVPLLLLLGGVYGPELIQFEILRRFHELSPSTDTRFLFPTLLWKLIQSLPFGCGFGRTALIQTQGLSWTVQGIPLTTLWGGFNSFWVNLFSRLGIPGISLFLLFLLSIFMYIWRNTRTVQHGLAKAFLYGGLAGFIGQTVIWMANNTYMLPGGSLNFWFFLGMLAAGSRAFAVQKPVVVMVPADALQNTQQFVPA